MKKVKKVVWDLSRTTMEDENGLNQALDEGFEPFSVTLHPSQQSALDPKKPPVTHMIWMKRANIIEIEVEEDAQ